MAKFKAISFSKRRPPQPRLSPVCKPGRKNSRDWSPEEEKVLTDFYETKGSAYCKARLPRRSMQSIYQHAGKMKLTPASAKNRKKPERRGVNPELDARIKELWAKQKGRGWLNRLAEQLKIPRWYLSDRALALGLSVPRKEPAWSEPEKKLLERHATKSPDVISRTMREHGYNRSPAAIKIKLVRWKIDREDPWHFSSRGASLILGIDSHAITGAIIEGDLKGVRRGTKRLVQQGGDQWVIKRADFRAYVLANIESIDIRKVDKLRFVDLLVKPAEPPAEGAHA